MSSMRSGFLCLVAGLGLVGCIGYLFPALPASLGLDLHDFSNNVRTLQEAGARSEALQAHQEETLARTAAKQDAVAAVIAGQLTLREAAARFRSVDEACPKFRHDLFCRANPGATDEERYRNVVLEYVRQTLQVRPGGGQDILRRLEAELRDDAPAETGSQGE
jgi:hypothetical protein